MSHKLQRNRSSLFAYIPQKMAETLNLKAGDSLDFRIENDHLKATPVYAASKQNTQVCTTPTNTEGNGND